MGFFEFLKSNGTIALDMEAADWKDAIRKGGSLLLQAGCCDGKYVEAMIDGCVRNGPYFVIGPGLAMPHARPENGVIKTGYALVTLKKGVEFGDGENDPNQPGSTMGAPVLHKEDLVYEAIELKQRSYK